MSAFFIADSAKSDKFASMVLETFERSILQRYRARKLSELKYRMLNNNQVKSDLYNFKFNLVGEKFLTIKNKLSIYRDFVDKIKTYDNNYLFRPTNLSIYNIVNNQLFLRGRRVGYKNLLYSKKFLPYFVDKLY